MPASYIRTVLQAPSQIHRRTFLGCAAAVAAEACWPTTASSAQAEIAMKTFTYKPVGDLEIKADVFRADDSAARKVVVWIHGGALIMGHRAGVSDRVKQWALGAGHVLVSIDYRLAPETQLPEIIQDVEDAFVWIRREGPQLFGADPSRIAVTGGSAGGYLTLTSGFRVQPRPTVLLSLWGYGDLVGDWYSKPSPHPRHRAVKLSREEAYRQVSGPPISDARDRQGDGGAFYQFCRQHGEWPKAVSGWDPIQNPEKFYPYMAVKNVSKSYPPTVIIHGESDTDVPHQQSVLMAQELTRHEIPHQLISIPGAEHGLAGGDPKLVDAAYQQAFAFLDRYMMS
jgi:acetyl esterase/lipase